MQFTQPKIHTAWIIFYWLIFRKRYSIKYICLQLDTDFMLSTVKRNQSAVCCLKINDGISS